MLAPSRPGPSRAAAQRARRGPFATGLSLMIVGLASWSMPVSAASPPTAGSPSPSAPRPLLRASSPASCSSSHPGGVALGFAPTALVNHAGFCATGVPVTSSGPVGGGSNGPSAAAWEQIQQTMPPSRFNAQLTYDAARARMVLFGGCCYSDGELDDTWTWDGSAWTEQHPTVSPVEREAGAFAYDTHSGTAVLFGGISCPITHVGGNLCNQLADTWTWDGSTWTQQHPATSPPKRFVTSMVYDAATGRVVLFGGLSCGSSSCQTLADTWTWDGATWTQQHPATSPTGRIDQGQMAYDAARGEAVLFSGQVCDNSGNNCTLAKDTWVWSGATWTQRQPVTSPPPRVQGTMAFDAARQRIVLFGGAGDTTELSDTWTWDGVSWIVQTPTTSPAKRQAASMEYDPTTATVLMADGFTFSGDAFWDDTWNWSGVAWTETPRTWPNDNYSPAMAYDADRHQTVLFGGQNPDRALNDTWTWDGQLWTRHHPAISPSPRTWPQMAYDAATHLVVLFGGYSGSGYVNDTWTWDGSTWTQQHPLSSPPARQGPSLAYDAARGQLVYFGPLAAAPHSPGDTWTWDGQDWTQRLVPAPPGRDFASMAYDGTRQKVVLFGGETGVFAEDSVIFNDTWTWDGSGWQPEHPAASPLPRYGAAMGYDPAAQAVILFSGENFQTGAGCALGTVPQTLCFNNDTWSWDGINWTEQDAGSQQYYDRSRPGHPSERSFAAAAEDATGQLLLFGGLQPGRDGNDAWHHVAAPAVSVPETRWPVGLPLLGLVMVAALAYGRRRSPWSRCRARTTRTGRLPRPEESR